MGSAFRGVYTRVLDGNIDRRTASGETRTMKTTFVMIGVALGIAAVWTFKDQAHHVPVRESLVRGVCLVAAYAAVGYWRDRTKLKSKT